MRDWSNAKTGAHRGRRTKENQSQEKEELEFVQSPLLPPKLGNHIHIVRIHIPSLEHTQLSNYRQTKGELGK